MDGHHTSSEIPTCGLNTAIQHLLCGELPAAIKGVLASNSLWILLQGWPRNRQPVDLIAVCEQQCNVLNDSLREVSYLQTDCAFNYRVQSVYHNTKVSYLNTVCVKKYRGVLPNDRGVLQHSLCTEIQKYPN